MLEEVRSGAELADATHEYHGHLQDFVPKASYGVDQRDIQDKKERGVPPTWG